MILVFAPLLGLLLDVAVSAPWRGDRVGEDHGHRRPVDAIPALVTWLNHQLINIFDWGIAHKSFDVTQVAFPPGVGPTPAEQWHLPFKVRSTRTSWRSS